MANFNKVILIGNMTRDIEVQYAPSGTAIGKGGIAINRDWNDQQSGEKKSETTFIDFVAFGRTSEVLAQYTKKGANVLLEGRLKLDQWDDKQTGQKRSKLNVVVDHVQLLGNRRGDGAEVPPPDETPARARGYVTAPAGNLPKMMMSLFET